MAIPEEHSDLVRRLRRFIKDEEDINELITGEENTDEFLYDCLIDAVDEINYLNMPITEYTLTNIPTELPWIIVRMGATLQYLTGAGIASARNTYTYSDGSGIQATDTDAWGRYINYYNVLIPKYTKLVTNFKLNKNIELAYGGVYSEYNDIWT